CSKRPPRSSRRAPSPPARARNEAVRMKRVLVVASETVGGQALLDRVHERAQAGDVEFFLVVPQKRPRHGGVIYLEAMYDAAEVRLSLAEQFLASEGIKIEGDVGDDDPFNATMDAIGDFKPDELVISTLPVAQSGWMRRDLVERITDASGLPVEHIVVDVDQGGLAVDVTLVVASQTLGEEALLAKLKEKAAHGRTHVFIV